MTIVIKLWMILASISVITIVVSLFAVMNAWASKALFSFFSVVFALVLVAFFFITVTTEWKWQKAQNSSIYVEQTLGVRVLPEVLFYNAAVFDRVLEQRLKDLMGKEDKPK